MSRISIAELQRLVMAGSPYVLDRQVREALLPLLRLARAVAKQREADPEWCHCDLDEFNAALDETNAALSAFDFGSTDAA